MKLLGKIIASSAIAISVFVTPLVLADEKKGLPHQHLKPKTAELIELLKKGGYVLVVRHERTNAFVPDNSDFKLENCANQRNLSVAGYANAIENGDTLRFLGISFDQVFSSPTCRTLETGRLMFGKVEPNDDLFGWRQDPDAVRTGFKKLITDNVDQDKNTALVTHLGTFSFVVGGHLAEGDSAVFSAENGEPKLLGVIPSNGWNDGIIDASLAARQAGEKMHKHEHDHDN